MNNSETPTINIRLIAQLARLQIKGEELPAIAAEFDKVLGFIEQLNTVSVDNIEPMAYPFETRSCLREDVVTEQNQRDEFLALAPESQSGLYLVPKVIE